MYVSIYLSIRGHIFERQSCIEKSVTKNDVAENECVLVM